MRPLNPQSKAASDSIHREVSSRFGVLPNFFRLTDEVPEITRDLWGFARSAYLDNPLPSLFKERLFVALSRFCSVRYCVARHLGFLIGLGRPAGDEGANPETIDRVLHLLRQPVPFEDDLESALEILAGQERPLPTFPEPETAVEGALFACATHLFVQSGQVRRSHAALESALEPRDFQYLLLFLAFVRTAHFWSELHPELQLEEDVEAMLNDNPAVSRQVFGDRSSGTDSPSVGLVAEVSALRREREILEQARRSAEDWRLLFEQAKDGIFIADREGHYLDVNPAGCEMLGYTREELVQRNFSDIVVPSERDRLRDAHARLTHDEVTTSEWHLRRRDGSVFIGEVVARRVPDGRWQSLVRDISERHRSRQLEIDHRRVLELIANDAPIEDACRAVVRMIEDQSSGGMLASILFRDETGTRLHRGIAESLPDAYMAAIDGIAIGPGVGSCGTAAWRKAPVYVSDIERDPLWVDFAELALAHGLKSCWSAPILSKAGVVLGTFAVYYPHVCEPDEEGCSLVAMAARTVAIAIERHQAAEALRESDARFRMLADNIPQLAWIADPGTEGQVHWFNQNWLEYTGTTLEEMRGNGWHSVHHPDHAEGVIRRFNEHVKQGLDWEDTFPLRGKEGDYRWFLSRTKCIRDESGAVVSIFGTNTDVTEQRRMEEQLRRATDELSVADRRKNEFLATLAHELRNPLAPIRNGLLLLQAGHGDPDMIDQTQAMMERQVEQLVRLVDDLMDVGRISSGTIVLRRARVDLADAVGSAVESSRSAFAEREQELELRLPDEPIALDADQTRLAQVFTNLLDNASKYSHRRGRIWLEAVPGEGGVTITVRDEGIGIAAEHLPFVFDLFSQVDSRHARSNSGLGIGLSLVRRIVELHGGTIEVSSGGLGEGSECTVRLPLGSSARSAPEPRQDDRVVPAYASLRILIIDDNEDHADSCNVLLRRRGHEVRTAYDGERGIAAALEFQPQVVLLDIGLPDVDGYEVCRRLQQEAGCRDATLIAISGWGQDDDRRRSREVGFHHHLVKPVAPLELDALLASLSVALGAH